MTPRAAKNPPPAHAKPRGRLPLILTAVFAVYLLAGLAAREKKSDYNLKDFGNLPVLNGGRLKPLDSMARTSLLMIRGKQSVRFQGKKMGATEWLLNVLYDQPKANEFPVFEIDDPDVLGMFGIQQTKNRYYSFTDLHPFLGEIESQASAADGVKPEQRSRFQSAAIKLQSRLILYQKLQNTLEEAGEQNVTARVRDFSGKLGAAQKILMDHSRHSRNNPAQKALFKEFERFSFLTQAAEFYPLPPAGTGDPAEQWAGIGQGFFDSMKSGKLHPGIEFYARLGDAYRASDAAAFNKTLEEFTAWLGENSPSGAKRAKLESLFNHLELFYRAMPVYILAFILTCLSWIFLSDSLYRSSFNLLILAFSAHTVGLAARMLIHARPPVTNLYSSAIFVGWVAVLLGILLERMFKRGIGNIAASMIGFVTLIIAHHLALEGDTLEMMRAVLDSNFWLATHVICITIGYASTFLSGFLAILYIFRRIFDPSWNEETADVIERMVYGVVCFSAFFSFVGTVLGGIWADQSWGRFWGWDPKENGALMIVLWNIFILHARIGKITTRKGIILMAVFGNVITALSWFGVNMLGIGLHSYGFMDKAFVWLSVFVAVQLGIMGLGLVPERPRLRQTREGSARPK